MATTMAAMMSVRSGLRRVATSAARRQLLASTTAVLQNRSSAAVVPLSVRTPRRVASPWTSQIKLLSTRTDATDASDDNDDDDSDADPLEPVLVYEGPMARAVRLMKGVSVTSCILTSIGMPTLCLISEQSTSMVGKWAMCGTIMLFGLGTTTLFHVLFKPYVMRMWVAPGTTDNAKDKNDDDPTVTVETVTLFAQLTKHSFKLSDVVPPAPSMHPMLSFQATGRNFFVHPEVFEDHAFAEKLLGTKLSTPRKSDDDEDDE